MIDLENSELRLYSISVSAKLLEISVQTLRMYEREGFIVPSKKKSSHRLYSSAEIHRLQCIRKAINELKISIAGIKTIFSLIPCWEKVKCSEAERKNREAYKSHPKPCWSFKHLDNKCSSNECRLCTVYKDCAERGQIKELIKRIVK